MRNKWLTFYLATLALLVTISFAEAQQLTYQPKNPNFGGNSFNAAPLLNAATAQSGFSRPSQTGRDSIQEFKERLDRSILSRLARDIQTNGFLNDAGVFQPGSVDTGINTISVDTTSVVGSTIIQITNNATGEVSTITVPDTTP
ncbi:MAG: curli assembly protein CsgF [Nitrospinaceae bacterium]